jgi:hypothetical protein
MRAPVLILKMQNMSKDCELPSMQSPTNFCKSMNENTQKLIFKVILASLKTILVNQKDLMIVAGFSEDSIENIKNMCELIDQVCPFCNQEPEQSKRVTLNVVPGF